MMDPSKMMPKSAMMGNARPDMMWHGAPNGAPQGPQVSVVTTVYPGMPAFAGPPQSYNTSTTHHHQQQQQHHHHMNHHQNGGGMFVGGHSSTPSSSYSIVGHPGAVSKSSSSSSNYGPMDGGGYGSEMVQHHPMHHQSYGGMGGGGGHHHGGQMNDFSSGAAPRHAAVAMNAAAAQATAAAVATATATATAVAIDQSQFQSYQPTVQYANQQYHQGQMGMGMGPQSDPYSSNSAAMMAQQQQRHGHPSPYVPVQGGMRATRVPSHPNMARYPNSAMAARGGGGQGGGGPMDASFNQYGISGTSGGGGPPNMAMMSQQRPMMAATNQQQHAYAMNNVVYQQQQQQQQQRFPGGGGNGGGQNYQSGGGNSGQLNAGFDHQIGPGPAGAGAAGAAPMQSNSYNHHQVNGVAAAGNYQNRGNYGGAGGGGGGGGSIPAPFPNNPTPPLTPAAAVGQGFGAGGGGGGGGGAPGVPPAGSQDDAEPRLTLSRGTILVPFRLEHNSPVSQHMFTLDERTYQALMSNSNLDLQLKCFHADDKATANNWPHNANIQICVNGSPVIVKSVERPLYIKTLCQKQQNTLQVAVQQCCCSHLFCLSIVSRPTIESVIREMTRTRSIAADQCVEKIRNFFNSGDAAQLRGGSGGVGTSNGEVNPDIEQMSVSMSLKCPITMKRIKLPTRGKECKHPQCFDLAAYLEINKDRSNWSCPICKKPAPMDSLEIDQYVLQILNKLSSYDADEVSMDSTAAWKPILKQPQSNENSAGASVKEEDSDVPCGSAKRFKSEPGFSPAPWQPSTSAPTPSTSAHFQSPGGFNRSESSVLSPFYQTNNSPSAAAVSSVAPPSFPSSVGTPGSSAAGGGGVPPFGSPRQKLSKSGPVPMINPPSVSLPGSSSSSMNNRGDLVDSSSILGFGGQQMQNPLFSGSSSFSATSTTSTMENTAGGYQTNGAASTVATSSSTTTAATSALSDFPDFTFDDSDLLGSGDMTQVGAGFLNDPEEWMKYLTDPSDNGPYAMLSSSSNSSNDQQRNSSASAAASNHTSQSTNPANVQAQPNSTSNYRNSTSTAYSSSELASMDEILALLRKTDGGT